MNNKTAKQAEELLKKRGLRNTEVRKKVLCIFIREEKALSKNDIENQLDDIDRITLYRTIKAFQGKGIVHKAIDGTSTTRYALCEDCSDEAHLHEHAHFNCEQCGNTYCLEEVTPPDISGVKGVRINDVELVLKGVCSNCL